MEAGTDRMKGPHGEEVGHHGAEARGEAGLGDEAQLELGQTDDVVSLLPVPAGDVEQVGLQCSNIITVTSFRHL